MAAEPDSYSDEKLDQLTDELFAELRGDGSDQRSGADFLLYPEHLPVGSVRHYVPGYLEWLGIPDEVLPRSRVYLHADLPDPAALESTAPAGAPANREFALYLDNGLLKLETRAAVAHECTHLHLVRSGRQTMTVGNANTRRLEVPWDEEIRTDIASFVLGFGVLMLNGVVEGLERDRQLGYLRDRQWGRVYRRVNELAGVSTEQAAEGLTSAAQDYLDGDGSD